MVSYKPLSIPELLTRQISLFPDKDFLVTASKSYSYVEFGVRVDTILTYFQSQGVKPGDHVALLIPNSAIFIFVWFALVKLGAVMIPLNPSYKSRELSYILTHAEVKLAIVEDNLVKEFLIATPHLTHILTSFLTSLPTTPLSNVSYFPEVEDLAAILYTSGTTGTPKGVMLSHQSYTLGGESFAYRVGLNSADRVLLMLPLFHVNAEIYSVMGALVSGATLILIDGFHASTFWDTVNKFSVTQFNFLGVIANILLKNPSSPLDTTHQVRLACGAGLSKQVIEDFSSRFHIPLLETYGLTEAPMGTSNLRGDFRLGSIGKPSKHPSPTIYTEVKLVGDDGTPTLPGQVGEIYLKTPALSTGYFRNPEATKEAFVDGWFRTGDYGTVDSDGYYYFVDRKKDIIRKKGENISSREIELCLLGLPGVSEVAVIPFPSPLGEDDIKAYIVLTPENKLDYRTLRSYCQAHLSVQKTPMLFEFVESLPKTPTAKIAKNELKKHFLQQFTVKNQSEVYILDGVRTPIAKFMGAYKDVRPDTLLAYCLTTLGKRNNIDCADDCFVGCVNQSAEAERNIARQAILLSSFSNSTPATTVNRLSASGLEAMRQGYNSLTSKEFNTVIVAGAESFSRAPFCTPRLDKNSPQATPPVDTKLGYNFLHPDLKNILKSSGEYVEDLARRFNLSREQQDQFAFDSNEKALSSIEDGSLPEVISYGDLISDEIPRPNFPLSRLKELPALYGDSSTLTSGNSSKLGDGAGAILLCSSHMLPKFSTKPLAKVLGFELIATEPAEYGLAPVYAIQDLLNKHDLTLDHLGVIEIHEAYAGQVLACTKLLHISPSRINKLGGAIALGHPFGLTGIRLVLSVAHQLENSSMPYGIVSICIGGGQALACLLSKV